jgi:hypothetical protein
MIDTLHHAVPPHQRLEAWFTQKETHPETVAQRRGLLQDVLFGPWRAIYKDDRLFMDGTIDAEHPDLPAWVRHAVAVASCEPFENARILGNTPMSREAFYLLSPITRHGLNLLKDYTITSGLEITDDAMHGMLTGLGRRILMSCIAVVDIEVAAQFDVAKALASADSFEYQFNETTYPDLYQRYPGLPYIIGNTVNQWHVAVVEMLTRLSDDMQKLQDEMFSNRPVLRLTDVSMDTGDLHDSGRSVALLTFNDGLRVAYKPKDLRIVDQVQRLFVSVNTLMGKPVLHTRKVLLGSGYAWEEFVEHVECADISEVELYYNRYGAMIRMYELLQARDLWLDNVVAHGPWPVVIDLEMVLQPWIAPSLARNEAEFVAQEIIEETAMPIGLVAMHFPIGPDQPPEDMGGLTTNRPLRTPFFKPEVVRTVDSSDQTVYITNSIYTPTVNGEAVDSRLWYDAVVAGYKEFDALLDERVMTEIHTWAKQLDPKLPVRAIYRDTWTYQQALNASCSARNLTSVYRREAFLARFPASRQSLYEYGSVNSNASFSELEQLRRQDIPYFINYISDGNLREGNGKDLGQLYHGSALGRLQKRCDIPVSASIRIAALSGALETCHGGRAIETKVFLGSEQPRLKAISDIAQMLISWSICVDKHYSWLTYTAHPAVDFVILESVRPCYSGLLKMAIALQKAYLCTGWSTLSPAIRSLHDQAEVARKEIIAAIDNGMGQSWHYEEASGLPGLDKGLAELTLLMNQPTQNVEQHTDMFETVLLSTTRIPPRLWLLGDNGVCALLDSLATIELATANES